MNTKSLYSKISCAFIAYGFIIASAISIVTLAVVLDRVSTSSTKFIDETTQQLTNKLINIYDRDGNFNSLSKNINFSEFKRNLVTNKTVEFNQLEKIVSNLIIKVLPNEETRNYSDIFKKTFVSNTFIKDVHNNCVAGNCNKLFSSTRVTLNHNGKTIAYVSLPKTPSFHAFKVRWLLYSVPVFILALLLSIALSLLITSSILRPIKQLSVAAKRIEKREFDFKIKIKCSDELGLLQHEYNKVAQSLKLYERQQKRWIGDLCHELNSPLTNMRADIQAMVDDVRPLRKDNLDVILDDIDQLSYLINDLQQIHSTKLWLKPSNFEVLDPIILFDSVETSFSSRLKAKNITTLKEVKVANPPLINADKNRLFQVFSNLLSNCASYCLNDTQVKIRFIEQSEWIRIEIEDDGTGVPDSDIPYIFDHLYRVEGSRNRDSGGSGLGLTICKTIIEAHSGSIEAQHGKSGGLLISLQLPLTTD